MKDGIQLIGQKLWTSIQVTVLGSKPEIRQLSRPNRERTGVEGLSTGHVSSLVVPLSFSGSCAAVVLCYGNK